MPRIDLTQLSTPQSRERDARQAAARAYLTETDWLITRRAETNKPVPADVLARRAQARADLDRT